ncbi:XRE family transcriptional regulator [Armatimonas sp.]|uniref:helix-turn-helix domain-containing protein n=1 Tax=Armatimonas sp. TaxID=1872638 RepID=UPI00286A47F2|nr:XRE family transcriptional regulator [Armatimonas sp.]
MPITQQQLAERLRKERDRLELTQAEVAERLQVKRPTIAQIEAGNRSVTSIELFQFAAIYKRDIEFFLAESDPRALAGVMHLRANTDLGEPVQAALEECVKLCQAATFLESQLGTSRNGVPFSYTFERPQGRWEAVDQGMRLAAMERKRLNLGNVPVRNIVEIIAQHGVRVARHTLTDDIAGLFFVGPDTGMAILVNAGHPVTRRLFSYAHEYAHLLVDSTQISGAVSRYGNRDELVEVRANAFAAHFLMPSDGVHEFLDGIGGPTRQVMEIYDGFKEQPGDEPLTAQRRTIPGSQEVKMIDALRTAHYFGTSYDATLYQLLNLKVIQRETLDKLLGEKERAERASILLGIPDYLERETLADLKKVMINLVVESWLQKKISRPKAHEYMVMLSLNPQDLDSLGDPD